MRQVELVRTAKDFGFQVEAELAEDAEQEDELCLFISDVTAGGIAAGKGQFNAIVVKLSEYFILSESKTQNFVSNSDQYNSSSPFEILPNSLIVHVTFSAGTD